MRHVDEEPDYLVRAQPELNPEAFEEVVREAFHLEHQCTQKQEIARILGVDKSRVSQILGHPENLKLETIQRLLSCLSRKEHRRRIVRAWAIACFGEDIAARPAGRLTGKEITARTLKRVDRQIRESRLAMAAHIAEEAASRAEDWTLQQQFLDRAYFARQRLDEPGQAMRIVRRIVESARSRGDQRRVAGGLFLKLRILQGMHDPKPEEWDAVFSEVESALTGALTAPPGEDEAYIVGDLKSLENVRQNARFILMQQGVIPLDADFVRQEIRRITSTLNERKSHSARFQSHLTLSAMHLLLAETFAAQDHLDAAYASGSLKNLNVYEMCGLLKGRILAVTESPEAAAAHLREVCRNCRHSQDLYHQRLAENELARLESSMISSGKSAQALSG